MDLLTIWMIASFLPVAIALLRGMFGVAITNVAICIVCNVMWVTLVLIPVATILWLVAFGMACIMSPRRSARA